MARRKEIKLIKPRRKKNCKKHIRGEIRDVERRKWLEKTKVKRNSMKILNSKKKKEEKTSANGNNDKCRWEERVDHEKKSS